MKTTLIPSSSKLGRRAGRLLGLSALVFGMLCLAVRVSAQPAVNAPPDLMSYQGYLTDVGGVALAQSGPEIFPVVFRIWSAPTSGTRLWSEFQNVTVDNGYFSVILGEGTEQPQEDKPPLSSVLQSNGSSERYIGITVNINGTDTDILPRLRLLPTPYAFLATRALELTAPSGDPAITSVSNGVEVTGELNASTVTISSSAANALYIPNAKDVTATGGGVNIGGGLFMDGNEIQCTSTLYLNSAKNVDLSLNNGGGNVAIGTSTPAAKLHVVGGGDLSLSGGGFAVFGSINGNNLVIDDNEIQARVNGASRNLFLNDEGGDVVVGAGSKISKFGVNQWYNNVTATIRAGSTHDSVLYMESKTGGNIFDFEANGTARKAGTATWVTISDARLKTVLGPFQHGLNEILKLEAIRYHYRDGNPRQLDSEREYHGFVAQSVQKVIPEAVKEAKDGYLELSMDPIYLAAINAIKELHQLIQEKEARIVALEAQATRWEALAEKLEKGVDSTNQVNAASEADLHAWSSKSSELEKQNARLTRLVASQEAKQKTLESRLADLEAQWSKLSGTAISTPATEARPRAQEAVPTAKSRQNSRETGL